MPIVEITKEEAENPMLEKADRVHDWRNYASDELIEKWEALGDMRVVVANCLQEIADNEHWD